MDALQDLPQSSVRAALVADLGVTTRVAPTARRRPPSINLPLNP